MRELPERPLGDLVICAPVVAREAAEQNKAVIFDAIRPYLKGEVEEAPRKEFFYWSDDGNLTGLRYGRWKMVFMEQRAHGFEVWQEPLVTLRVPKLIDMRGDPFERASHDSVLYDYWRFERAFALVPAQAFVANWLASFKEFPPRMKPASFSLDQVMEKLEKGYDGQ